MNESRLFWADRKEWRPLGLSVVVHTLIAWLLIVWCFSGAQQPTELRLRPGGIVLAVQSTDQDQEYLTKDDSLEELTPAPPSAAAISAATNSDSPPAIPMASPSDTMTNPELSGVRPSDFIFDAAQMANVPKPTGLSTEFQLSPEDLQLIEADRKLIKSRQPVGQPTSISVFGSGKLTGRDFVFVLDRSKSMGSSGLGVIEASRFELAQAISMLEEHHHFQIVGYHDRTVTMSTRQMLSANETNKNAVAPFIRNLVAFGGTQHENGLIAAIAFQPDVIVLMTDGGYPELNVRQLKLLQQLAGSKTEIHCLQFGFGPQQQQINFMTKLAQQNRGSFHYIDVNQWKKQP